jgi:hypothetical protein
MWPSDGSIEVRATRGKAFASKALRIGNDTSWQRHRDVEQHHVVVAAPEAR